MTVTHYFWDPVEDNVIEEYDENGDTIVEYETEPDLYGNLISQDRDGVASYYHFDGQGSTLALTNKDGDITDEYDYNAFGDTTEENGTTENSRRYVGEKGYEHESTGNHYYVRRRSYSPVSIRWLSQDPLIQGWDRFLFDLASWHAYRYASNNPVIHTDPSGLDPMEGEDDGTKCCCCCIEGLDVPLNSIKNNSKVPSLPGTFWVRQFDAVIDTSWKVHPKQLDCEFEWWEWSNIPLPGEKSATKKKWIKTSHKRTTKGSQTFAPWVSGRKMPCPTKTNEVTPITDYPALPLNDGGTWDYYLFIAIKVTSAKDCPCDNSVKREYVFVHLTTIGGTGNSRDVTPYDDPPKQWTKAAGLPKNFTK